MFALFHVWNGADHKIEFATEDALAAAIAHAERESTKMLAAYGTDADKAAWTPERISRALRTDRRWATAGGAGVFISEAPR